jgi:hypothetical protein
MGHSLAGFDCAISTVCPIALVIVASERLPLVEAVLEKNKKTKEMQAMGNRLAGRA